MSSQIYNENQNKTRKKVNYVRNNLPLFAVRILKQWIMSPEHCKHPYPTPEEKDELLYLTGISPKQLKNWFTNARKRVWRPLMQNHVRCSTDGNSSGIQMPRNDEHLESFREAMGVSWPGHYEPRKRKLSDFSEPMPLPFSPRSPALEPLSDDEQLSLLEPHAEAVLQEWYDVPRNKAFPYPSPVTLESLCQRGNVEQSVVKNWLFQKRKSTWKHFAKNPPRHHYPLFSRKGDFGSRPRRSQTIDVGYCKSNNASFTSDKGISNSNPVKRPRLPSISENLIRGGSSNYYSDSMRKNNGITTNTFTCNLKSTTSSNNNRRSYSFSLS